MSLGLVSLIMTEQKCMLLVDFLTEGETINTSYYCDTLKWLQEEIHWKQLGLLSRYCVAAWQCQVTLDQQHMWLVMMLLDHPFYSPDQRSSDFHLFGLLKRQLGGDSQLIKFSKSSCHSSGAWHWLLQCWLRCLGVPLEQIFRKVWRICGKIIYIKAIVLFISICANWINLHIEPYS